MGPTYWVDGQGMKPGVRYGCRWMRTTIRLIVAWTAFRLQNAGAIVLSFAMIKPSFFVRLVRMFMLSTSFMLEMLVVLLLLLLYRMVERKRFIRIMTMHSTKKNINQDVVATESKGHSVGRCTGKIYFVDTSGPRGLDDSIAKHMSLSQLSEIRLISANKQLKWKQTIRHSRRYIHERQTLHQQQQW